VYFYNGDAKAKYFHDERIKNLSATVPHLVATSSEKEANNVIEKNLVSAMIFGSARHVHLAEKYKSTRRIIIFTDPTTDIYQETQKRWHSLGAIHCPTIKTVKATLSSPEFIPLLALIAHNERKKDLAKFLEKHKSFLSGIPLMATETTGKYLIERGIIKEGDIVKHNGSGPTGGDAEVVAAITKGKVAAVIFLKDHLTSHPHGSDILTLDRNCDIWEIPLATNEATAEALLKQISELGWKNFVNQRNPKLPKQVQRQKDRQKNKVLKTLKSNNPVHKQKHAK